MMLIQVLGGATVGYEEFTFPDGQRHITLNEEIRAHDVCVTASITDADSLFDLLLLKDVLDNTQNKVFLRIEYLMGARMDRRTDDRQPFTLKVVAEVLRNAGFESIRVLDPHSFESLRMLNASAMYPGEFADVLAKYDPKDTVIVQPDAGARERIDNMVFGTKFGVVACSKDRDQATGELSGFKIHTPRHVRGKHCLIVDDICDGGGTFIGLAKMLMEAGAVSVDLFVTHGIFSKGLTHLWKGGIRNVYYTDSFKGKVHPKPQGARTFAEVSDRYYGRAGHKAILGDGTTV